MNKAIEHIQIPRHVAVIMDGNGRWAKKRNKPRIYGHRQAKEAIQTTVEFCLSKGVLALTFFVFSTENWQRPKEEVRFLMELLKEFLERSQKLLHKNKIKLQWLGNRDNIPARVRKLFEQIIVETKDYDKMTLGLAVDYGGRSEIMTALKSIHQKMSSGEIKPSELTANHLEAELYSKDLPPLDLIIRTSGERRLSNFMLWQAAYSELYFCETLWPDFGEGDLILAFDSYNTRTRRWGKVVAER